MEKYKRYSSKELEKFAEATRAARKDMHPTDHLPLPESKEEDESQIIVTVLDDDNVIVENLSKKPFLITNATS